MSRFLDGDMSPKKPESNVTIPDRSVKTPVELSSNVTFQWLYGGAAYIIEVRSSRRDDIDIYIDTSLQLVAEWDRSKHFHSLQDISNENFEMTTYLRGRLNEVLKAMRESGMEGRSVIVMSNGFTGRVMQILGRFFAQQAKPIIQEWMTDRAQGEIMLAKFVTESEDAQKTMTI